TLKTLYTLLTMKQQEITQQVKQQKAVLNYIKNVQSYVNEASTSSITLLTDIDHVMSQSAEMKSIRRNLWISACIIGIIQYSS
ncbi:MerR family transcriptional regulator, partial [Staphylococcus aureus]